MAAVSLSTIIDADIEHTFGVLADWRFNKVWERELVEYEPVAGEERRFRWVRIVGGRRTEGILEVTALEPPHRIEMAGPAGDMAFRSEITLRAQGERTRVVAEVALVPRGLARLFDAMIERQLRRQATGNLQVLKALVEATSLVRRPSLRSIG